MKYIFTLICLVIFANSYCEMITVALDGTGDHTSIQEAINSSVDGDSIVVNPGIYYENIDYNGKTISIGSLNMLTSEDQYIHNTIIDGHGERRVVTIENGEGTETTLMGFTIRNGGGYDWNGGGIRIVDSGLRLINCIVENNYAYNCNGGVSVANCSTFYISGCTIRNNIAAGNCGGLGLSVNAQWEFDQNNLNSIYGNYGPHCCDFTIGMYPEDPFYSTVYLDTFSCAQPEKYFVQSGPYGNTSNWEYIDLHVNTVYYEFYDRDIYVSPDGDDANSGISPDEPMQTIAGAMTRIISNPDNPNTIYLAAGVYSPGLNNQIFPLSMKAYVNIIGEDMDSVIWDGDGNELLIDYYGGFEYEIRNITFIDLAQAPGDNIKFVGSEFASGKVYLNNLTVLGCYESSFYFGGYIEFEMNNINIGGGLGGVLVYTSKPGQHSIITNSIVQNASSGISHQLYYTDPNIGRSRLDVINHLNVDNCSNINCRWLWSYNSTTWSYAETNLINCTIMNNTCEDLINPQACVLAKLGANINIYNCCVYENLGHQLAIDTDGSDFGSIVNVSHSLIQNSDWVPILSYGVHSEVNWLGGNLDCDPMVDDNYTPIAGSPLIDAGTLSLPDDIELPETDVYGNPRIYGNGVDIGAIEWQETGINQQDIEAQSDEIIIYPNPLIAGSLRDGMAKILWEGKDRSEGISFEVFNIKGQRIANLGYDSEEFRNGAVNWDLCDNRGKPVSSGVYFVRVKAGDCYVAQKKVTVVR